MKKNKMMRLASVLLVLVLLTTSIISGTFAKYVTEGSVSDTARVAKFGVAVTGTGELFSKTYKKVGNGNGPSGYENDGDNYASLTVEAEEEVVAPGTKSSTQGLEIGVSGQPEVDVVVTFNIDFKNDVFLKAGNNLPNMTQSNRSKGFVLSDDYYPIVYTLKQGDTVIATGTSKEFKEMLAEASVYYDAGTDLSEIAPFRLTWEWDFDDDGKGTNDKADTLLGDLAADPNIKTPTQNTLKAGTDYCLNVDVTLTVTVTQVD